MADIMSRAKRSALMSRIRGTDTGIERRIFECLSDRRVPFERHSRDLPGKPDIVLQWAKLAVFVDGDFWHGWQLPRWGHKLPPRWREKITANRKRDQRNFARLRRRGWCVLRVWEHDVKRDPEAVVDRILQVSGKPNGSLRCRA
jgi:DNA mismatch endonuclease (patch repair protein)